jgi:FkbM family methyltransferase
MNLEKNLKTAFKKPIILLGAGQLAKMALEMWPQQLPYPIRIIDQNPTVDHLFKVPCDASSDHFFDSKFTYVLSFFKAQPLEVKNLFKKIGQPIITVYDILTHFNSDEFSNGWSEITPPDQAKKLMEAFTKGSDKKLINDVLEWRSFRNLSKTYLVNSERDKYNLEKFDRKKNWHFDLLIDGGCYDLSFVAKAVEQDVSFGHVIAFEPDELSNQTIKSEEHLLKCGNVELRPDALYGTIGDMNFNQSGLLSSRIVTTKTKNKKYAPVNCVTLTSVLSEYFLDKPYGECNVLIKLHVEGSEWSIIQESVRDLSHFKNVVILINLSHDRESLVELPILLAANNFQLTLHSHSLFGEGLTLKAIRSTE